MKFFTNRRLWQKMLIVILGIIMISFVCARPVHADWITDIAGNLFDPIMNFIVGLGDTIIGFLQNNVLGLGDAFVTVDRGAGFWSTVLAWAAAIVVIAGVIILSVVTAGAAGVTAALVFHAIMSAIKWGAVVGIVVKTVSSSMLPGSIVVLPQIKISPQEIFTNQIAMLDINFVNPHDSSDFQIPTIPDENGNQTNTIAQDLREVISSWYTSLRNVTLVGLMIVLLYVGIRILLSSVASDKAKYKQMLRDWVIALCILFFLHYIMAFSISIVEQITKSFASMLGTYIDPASLEGKTDEEKNEIIQNSISSSILEIKKIEDQKIWEAIHDLNDSADNYYAETGILGNGNIVNWIITNAMSQARFNYQINDIVTYTEKDENGNIVKREGGTDTAAKYGWGIAYLALVCFTLYFMFIYLKRLIYMAFLTMISPLIALTYPIDKMNDGQAQAFNTWLKEYLFNLLLQPMHLILYTVLIGSAMELAAKNILYVIVAFGFMVPAEKLLRRFFGFEKASTPGALGGAAGAALAVSGVKTLSNLFKGKSSDDKKEDSSKEKEIRQKDNFDEFGAFGESANGISGTTTPRTLGNGEIEKGGDTSGEVNKMPEPNPEFDKLNFKEPTDKETKGASEETTNGGQGNIGRAPRNDNSSSVRPPVFTPFRPRVPRKERLRRAIRASALNSAAARQKRFKSKGGVKGYLKRAGKFSTGILGGAAAATAVGIASLVTGDPSKIASNMAAGAAAGYTLGKELPGKAYGALATPGTIDALKKGYYGEEEYSFMQKEKEKKEILKSVDLRRKLMENYNYDDKAVSDMLSDHGAVAQLYDHGIDDVDDIMAAQQLVQSNTVKNYEEAAATARLAKRVGDVETMKDKDREEWAKTFKKQFGAKYGEDKAEQLTQDTFEKINQFNHIRYKR